MDSFRDIIGLLAVLIAATAAFFSYLSVKTNKTVSFGSLILEFLKEYGDINTSNALRLLRQIRTDDEENFDVTWIKALRKQEDWAIQADAARRLISHYFNRGNKLYKKGFINKKTARTITQLDGVYVFFSVVEKMEYQLNNNYNRELFNDIRELVGTEWQRDTGVKQIPVRK